MESSTTETTPVLAPPFLGNVVEICIVTPDHKKTIAGLLKLGIGPFQIHHFTPSSVSQQTFRGAPASFSLIVCFATQGSIVWEIMQPVSGPSLMAEFLEKKGEGIHHVAFDCGDVSVEKRREVFRERGCEVVMSGVWSGRKGRFSEDWEDPEDTVWYPAKE